MYYKVVLILFRSFIKLFINFKNQYVYEMRKIFFTYCLLLHIIFLLLSLTPSWQQFTSDRIYFEWAPPVAELFCAQSWQKGGARFNLRSRLSTYQFSVSRGFLQNLRKYGLESLKNSPHGGHFSYRPTLTLQSTKFYFLCCHRKLKMNAGFIILHKI